jgi:hypothetical protein
VAMMKVIDHVIHLVNDLVNVSTGDRLALVVVVAMDLVKPHGHLAILQARNLVNLNHIHLNLIKVIEPHVVMIVVPHPQVLEAVVIKGEILVQKDNLQDIKVVRHVNQDNPLVTKDAHQENQDNLLVIKVAHQENQDNLLVTKAARHVNLDNLRVTKEKDLATKAEIIPLKNVILKFIF